MLDTVFRHYCRNPRCRSKLAAPVENPRRAFCATQCFASFYRSRCMVCERNLPPGAANRRVCARASCRAEIRRFPLLYALAGPTTAPSTKTVEGPQKTSIESRANLPDRMWGPSLSERSLHFASLPLDPDSAARVARANDPARIRRETAWNRAEQPKPIFTRNTPPLNLIGGYKFPDAPVISRATDKIGAFAGVSGRTVEKIAGVVEAAEAEPERFGGLLADMDRTGRVNGVYRRLNVIKQAAEIRKEPPPLPGNGQYRVIVADPPWPYEIRDEDPSHRAVYPYPTMTIAQICATKVTAAVIASIALQHGVPLETIRRALLRDPRGQPSSPLGAALDLIAEAAP
jgi:hypothetical protein